MNNILTKTYFDEVVRLAISFQIYSPCLVSQPEANFGKGQIELLDFIGDQLVKGGYFSIFGQKQR